MSNINRLNIVTNSLIRQTIQVKKPLVWPPIAGAIYKSPGKEIFIFFDIKIFYPDMKILIIGESTFCSDTYEFKVIDGNYHSGHRLIGDQSFFVMNRFEQIVEEEIYG